jgi:TolB protein
MNPPRPASLGVRRTLPTLTFLALVLGCSGSDPSSPDGNEQPDPTTLVVTIQTTGVEIDANGYTLKVNSGAATAVAVNTTQTFEVPAGTSTVVLGDVSVACSAAVGTRGVDGTITLSVTVAAGGSQTLALDLECEVKDIVYLRAHSDGERHELHRISIDGTGSVPLKTGSFFWTPRWSPDGTRIAYVADVGNANSEIFVMNADGTGDQLICCGTGSDLQWDQSPTWSPDGQSIAWASTRSDASQSGIWRMDPDGGNRTQLTDQDDVDPDWGPDGRIVFARFTDPQSGRPWDLYVMDGDGQNVTVLATAVSTGGPEPRWSPDGQTILFRSEVDPSGASSIWSVSASGGTPVQRTGESLESSPAWSPDGSQIVFEYWGDYPWPPSAHGLCVGDPSGTTCTRITTNSGQGFFDIDPDWR